MNVSALVQQWSARLGQHIPPGQFGRYLLVGAWNTAFGYGSFAFFTALLSPVVPHSYIVASAISSLLNISVSYFGYKIFVFKTKGDYMREWIRCVAVYSGGILMGLVETLLKGYLPAHYSSYSDAAAFVVLILILLVRPSGLLGERA